MISTKPITRFISCALAFLGTASFLPAGVTLPGLFTDHLVLQQGQTVSVWGWADDGETVTVHFRDQTVKATARNGQWMVRLKKFRSGGPDVLTVAGKNQIELQDVLVGEVWIASGQSNMQFPLSRSFESGKDIAASANPNLRLFTVPRLKALEPTNDVHAAWQLCGPGTVPGFSAVAYYFGRDLQRALNVPVGIIHTSWGGSPAEVWMSRRALAAKPEYEKDILDRYESSASRYLAARAQWQKERAEAKDKQLDFNKPAPRAPWRPTELYNGMIAPLIPYAIKGAIWYQGEANAGRAYQYRSLFPDMIRNWRKDWNQGDFTFLAVQLAPYDKRKHRPLEEIANDTGESDWAELREAQVHATEVLPEAGLAVITDVGEKDDIHPTKKAPVGERLALAARAIAYHQDVEFSGPVFEKMKVTDGKAVLSFKHTGEGLEARGGALQGFTIAGPDHRFVRAQAEIQGNKVVVSSPEVSKPVAVRFGWADYPVVNFWNKNGLPASPFRTDKFPMSTQPNNEK